MELAEKVIFTEKGGGIPNILMSSERVIHHLDRRKNKTECGLA